MNPAIALSLLLQVLIPALTLAGLRRQTPAGWWEWLLRVFPAAVYFTFAVLLLPWGHVPYVLRAAWPLLLVIEGSRMAWRMRQLTAARRTVDETAEAGDAAETSGPAQPTRSRPSLFPALLVLPLLPAIGNTFTARRVPEPALEVAFPLRQGIYVVGHGGSHPSLNYHNKSASQRYALDISKLNFLSMRALGFGPPALDRYAIFGDTLYSPCDATVRSTVDGLPDQTPPRSDGAHPAGNHVELEAHGVRIFLAHMRRGSVKVRPGERVRTGDPLGEVGNSGNTTEPHLHIHAVRGGTSLSDGVGVPLTFRGRFLVRNDLIW